MARVSEPTAARLQTEAKATAGAFYRPELDSLRFLAFLGVFLTHTLPERRNFYLAHHLPGWLAACTVAGGYGVDLFFVLSGYLITELLLRERDRTGTVDLRAFYLRRVLRIWPLYFFFLGLAALLAVLHVAGQELSPSAVLAFLLLSGNWYVAFSGYPRSVIFPLWSISMEEQFYLLWAPVARKVSRPALTWVALALLAVASGTRVLVLSEGVLHPALWCMTVTHLDPIAAGILIAVLMKGRIPNSQAYARVSFFLAGCVACVLAANLRGTEQVDPPFWGSMAAYPLATAGVVLMFFAILGSGFTFRPAVWLGKISYGLYVYHALTIRILWQLLGNPFLSVRHFAGFWLGALGLNIAIAAASYKWLEGPFLQLKAKYSRL